MILQLCRLIVNSSTSDMQSGRSGGSQGRQAQLGRGRGDGVTSIEATVLLDEADRRGLCLHADGVERVTCVQVFN